MLPVLTLLLKVNTPLLCVLRIAKVSRQIIPFRYRFSLAYTAMQPSKQLLMQLNARTLKSIIMLI